MKPITARLRAAGMIVVCAAALLASNGCFTFEHTVGNGPQTGVETYGRQWYALWGLVRINDADGGKLAGKPTDYRIETEWSFLDIVINIFTSFVTVYSQSVTVTR